jgi:ABC-type amino acid transport substrate-binding protein
MHLLAVTSSLVLIPSFMISVIICSADPSLLAKVKDNIKLTIGVPFEIIGINNKDTGKGICEVYNEGVRKAKFEILCLMHEDVIIKTNDWGNVLISIFKDKTVGLVGVAGSSYRPLTPANWGSHDITTVFTNIIQTFKFREQKDLHDYLNPRNERLSQVTCVDGVWLATTKSVALETKFDDKTFKAFHGYDIDFSLAVAQKYKVVVTFDVLINHLSEGSFDRNWMADNLKLFFKWNELLPFKVGETIPRKRTLHTEKVAFKGFINQLIEFKFPMSTAFKVLWNNNRFWKLSPKLFFKLKFYILKMYLFASKRDGSTTS